MIQRLIKVIAGYLIAIGILLLGLIIFAFIQLHGAHLDKTSKDGGLYGLILALLPLVTGVGLILKKNWARISLFVTSVGTLLIGVFTICGFLFSFSHKHVGIKTSESEILFCSIFFIVIPALFILFFMRKDVMDYYLPGGSLNKRPLGVTLIAYYHLIGILGIFSVSSHNFKIPLGIVFLEGNWAIAYLIITTMLSIYIGIGLLKLYRNAWIAGISYHGFFLILGILNILMANESTILFIRNNYERSFTISLMQYKLLGGFSILLPVIIIGYLISKRNLFVLSQVINDSKIGIK